MPLYLLKSPLCFEQWRWYRGEHLLLAFAGPQCIRYAARRAMDRNGSNAGVTEADFIF